ncbi:MAG: methyltransferase domain-containing protein [Actinomycetota bacterium]
MTSWRFEHLRHAATVLRRGRNPAAAVYDSIGPDFFLALDEGWLNLGLWEGDGRDDAEAPLAVRRLVRAVAGELPSGAAVLDVGNGLGAQDPLLAEVARPRLLVALNVTRSQLVAGAADLARAGASAVNGDATRMPLRDGSVDGVISVEAAFHFPSRRRFFAEAIRVLRPGGVLTMSDIATQRMPRGPREVLAGVTQLRVWGLGTGAAATAGQIVEAATRAGFEDVRTQLVGPRVIGPALRFVRRRLASGRGDAPLAMRLACRLMLSQVELLWQRGVVDYVFLRASKPGQTGS